MFLEAVYTLEMVFKVIERVEVFMCNSTICLAPVPVYCFSDAAYGVGEDYHLKNSIKIKRRCTIENITQEASAFG
jgi:hypothetical protein